MNFNCLKSTNREKPAGFVGMSHQEGIFCPILKLGKIQNLQTHSKGRHPREKQRKRRTWLTTGEPCGCHSPAQDCESQSWNHCTDSPDICPSPLHCSYEAGRSIFIEFMRFIKMHISVIRSQAPYSHLVFNCTRAHWKNAYSSTEGLYSAG